MHKTTTPETAAAWADAQVRRHKNWPVDILGAGPRCAGNCKQGRALCVSPEACSVQKPVLLAPAEELQADKPRKVSEQSRGEQVGNVIGWSVIGLLVFMGVVSALGAFGIGPSLARLAQWAAEVFR